MCSVSGENEKFRRFRGGAARGNVLMLYIKSRVTAQGSRGFSIRWNALFPDGIDSLMAAYVRTDCEISDSLPRESVTI